MSFVPPKRQNGNQGEFDFWQRKNQIDKRNVAATLLIDLSGSMTGQKSEAALQGAILFWESLMSLGVSTSISGFKMERIPIVDFNESIVLNSRKKVANMLNMVGSVNHDAVALRSAYEDLIVQPADEHVLIVISDGQPVGDNANAELSDVVEQIRHRVHLIGLGLGEDTEHVSQFYPHAIGSIPVPSLSREIGSVLQKVLRRR
jgi:cobalamin biosynthesis protein CobT